MTNVKQGRTLDEYDVVYITRGRGTFEPRVSGRHAIEAGDVFVLFPGVWHRYTPDTETGWDEQWIGFNGAIASQLMRAPFFLQKEPVLRIGVDESLRQRFIALFNDIKRDPAGAPLSGTSRILEILGLIQERAQSAGANGRVTEVIRLNRARDLLASTDLPITEVATQTGFETIFYFSECFKKITGQVPSDYRAQSRG